VNKHHLLLALVSAAGLGWSVPMASGADKPIMTTKVLLRDPVVPEQRRWTFLSKDPSIVFGSNGDSDTPTTHGASVMFFNPATSECQCFVLPATGWSLGGAGDRYAYRDNPTLVTPVKLVLIRNRKLKIVARGANLTGITLDETSQGQIEVHYTSGTANKLCGLVSAPRVDRPQVYVGVDAPAPGACAAEPVGCSPCVPPIVP
jgi:hypothetical protein